MRSSKQRQRNKQNRQNRPSGGNIINRVFDSSGPEGKVRGTPAQIIEKYLQLHRDAQLAGDRVNAENFAQHAEHYTRLLAEAQRDIERAREEQEQFHRERQQERERQFEQNRESRDGGNRDNGNRDNGDGGRDRPREFNRDRGGDRNGDGPRERSNDFRDRPRFRPAEEQPAAEPSFLSQPLFPVLVADPEDDAVPGPGLVETPEEAPRSERSRREERRFDRERRPRRDREEREPAPAAAEAPEPVPVVSESPTEAPPTPEAAEPAPRARRPRKPRAPRDEAPAAATPDAAE